MFNPEPIGQGETKVSYVLETDQAPEFWQFLNGLREHDLLVELIVNELDARSSFTEIRFEADRLICCGRGQPVDEEGWARLRMLKGAGHRVKAKVGLFGVKNHGLKACFTLGNEIVVRSAGKQILQTLFANGTDADAFPGVRVPPLDDPDAPEIGAQIEVPYRRKAFNVPHGEALSFPAVTDSFVEEVFQRATATLPKRLLGIVRPGVLEDYTLVLSHHSFGRRMFKFSCGRPKRISSLVVFHRACHETYAASEDILVAREEAALSLWSPTATEMRPQFFQSTNYRVGKKRLFAKDALVIEAAWPVDPKGRLKSEAGQLRYPVSYPGETEASLSGMGVHYSGPFVSSTERHELGAQAHDWNDALIAVCDKAMCVALSTFLLKRHGAPALALVASLPDEDRLQQFAERLLKARVLPAVDSDGKRRAIPRGSCLVVPTYDDNDPWSAELAAVAPAGMPILHPKTPLPFVALLASGQCEGWNENHLRYDGADVVDRLVAADAEHFPWRSDAEWRHTLSQPDKASAHLDALMPLMSGADKPSGQDVHLPDCDGRLHPLHDLKRGVSLPGELIGLDLPPVIHPQLRDHRIFKYDGWRLQSYAFRDLLADGALEQRPVAVRKRFFKWLAQHPDEISRDDWSALRGLPIWPSTDGSLQTFDQLCLVSAKLDAVLGTHIRRPSREVRRLALWAEKHRARLSLRVDPSAEELANFYRASLSGFPTDGPLAPAERLSFHKFESKLAVACHSRRVARALRAISDEGLALNRHGALCPVADLIRESDELQRLSLDPADLLDRPCLELDEVLAPARKVTPAMALAAIRHDPSQVDALLPRLRIATSTWVPAIKEELRALPCIPIDGKLRAPDELAFKGNQGDFWGDWKIIIGAGGLADDAQELYRAAGVIRSFPESATSRAFFEWLTTQGPAVIARHLDCIIRHLAHRNGVGSWRLQPPELPCVPVEMQESVELLSLSDAKRLAAVDDFPELAEAIKNASPPFDRRLAIHSVASCSQPVADQLRDWGVPTLTSLLKGPLGAIGDDPTPGPSDYLATIHGLASRTAARRFRKQLQELDVHQSLIEPQFQRRLVAIKRVIVAGNVRAHYKIGRRSFHPQRSWAVLTDEIWLDASGDVDDLLMKAIADLVFVHPHPRYLAAILGSALATRARDFRSTHLAANDGDLEERDAEDEHDDEVGEAARPHPGGEPDPSRNRPNPGLLYSGGGGVRKPGGGTSRPQIIAEDIQRRQLKAEHYAHHCQIELATRSPGELAPAGSYAEFAENRRKIMEAHHPDKVGSHGSRHAGNLLILSHVNHERLGTRVTRQDITSALEHAWTPRTIFNPDGTVWLEGGVAGVVDKVTGEPLPLFFTHAHRAYWLGMAGLAS